MTPSFFQARISVARHDHPMGYLDRYEEILVVGAKLAKGVGRSGAARLHEVLNSLFGSPVYENYGRMIADRAFEPAAFRLALGLKDVEFALEASRDSAVPMPIAGMTRDQFLSAIADGLEDADWSAVSEIAARNAGLT
jgi:3-hydroxyisobutyrate dehydrogenase-like beta-hydroxyacid dehydrogenase